MGSTPFGDSGPAAPALVTPQDMKVACGSNGCALERDRT